MQPTHLQGSSEAVVELAAMHLQCQQQHLLLLQRAARLQAWVLHHCLLVPSLSLLRALLQQATLLLLPPQVMPRAQLARLPAAAQEPAAPYPQLPPHHPHSLQHHPPPLLLLLLLFLLPAPLPVQLGLLLQDLQQQQQG
jgi:hypothetical protein